MCYTAFTAVPYVPLALLALALACGLTLPTSLATTGSRDPGVSLTEPGGAGHSPGHSIADTRGRRTEGPTEREIRERSKPWEIKRLESNGWKLLMSDHFALRGDPGSDALRLLAVHAELTFDALRKALGGDASDLRLSIRIFEDEHEFNVFASIAGAKGAASFYDPRNAEAVVRWDSDKPRDATIRLLRHEVTHLYMDRVFGRREPLWLCEGLAEWIENSAWEDGVLKPGAGAAHADVVKTAVSAGTALPLRKLLVANRDEFYHPDRVALTYGQAWSLVKFLATKDPELLKKLAAGGKLGELRDLKALEEEWKEANRR
jgi:hypothetical protein